MQSKVGNNGTRQLYVQCRQAGMPGLQSCRLTANIAWCLSSAIIGPHAASGPVGLQCSHQLMRRDHKGKQTSKPHRVPKVGPVALADLCNLRPSVHKSLASLRHSECSRGSIPRLPRPHPMCRSQKSSTSPTRIWSPGPLAVQTSTSTSFYNI